LHPIARTVSHDRVVDEFVFEFTHDSELPWMLPGISPTGRHVRIPTMVVMGFHGDKVAYEHIYWDQASLLVQIGLIDPALLPISGHEEADRLLELARGTERDATSEGTLPRR
jgi:carboxymethylenebutenolidase